MDDNEKFIYINGGLNLLPIWKTKNVQLIGINKVHKSSLDFYL